VPRQSALRFPSFRGSEKMEMPPVHFEAKPLPTVTTARMQMHREKGEACRLCHAPRRRGIQYALMFARDYRRQRLLDRPPEFIIGAATSGRARWRTMTIEEAAWTTGSWASEATPFFRTAMPGG